MRLKAAELKVKFSNHEPRPRTSSRRWNSSQMCQSGLAVTLIGTLARGSVGGRRGEEAEEDRYDAAQGLGASSNLGTQFGCERIHGPSVHSLPQDLHLYHVRYRSGWPIVEETSDSMSRLPQLSHFGMFR